MGSQRWPRDDLPRWGRSRLDLRALSAMAFLISAAGLIGISLLVPGYVRMDWLPEFVTIGVVCLIASVVTLWRGWLSAAWAAVIIAGADVAVLVAGLSLADRSGGRVVAAVLVLPTIFIALFLSWPWLAGQTVAATGVGAVVLGISGDRTGVLAVQLTIVLVCGTAPAVVVLMLRQQLDDALRRSHQAATTDPLTGLLNRRGLDEQVRRLWARAKRESAVVGVLIGDIDHFKRVNDRHGHATGDAVLRDVARAALDCVRADDLVVRLGGEEIAVVGVAAAPEDFEVLAERFRAVVERVGEPWGVTVSIGLAWRRPVQGDAPAECLWWLIDQADDRMYEAKRGGRNQVRSA